MPRCGFRASFVEWKGLGDVKKKKEERERQIRSRRKGKRLVLKLRVAVGLCTKKNYSSKSDNNENDEILQIL